LRPDRHPSCKLAGHKPILNPIASHTTHLLSDSGMLPFARQLSKESGRSRASLELRAVMPGDAVHSPAANASEIAVFFVDPAGAIAGWTLPAAGLTGYTGAEIVGQELAVLFTLEARAAGHPSSELALALRTGRVEEQIWLVQKDGQRIWAEIVINPLRDDTGAVTGFACQSRDISAEKNAEARRISRAEQLSALALTRQDVATYGLELAALLPRIAMRARELTGADSGVIELRDGVGDQGRAHDGDATLDVALGRLLVPHGGATTGARLRCLRYDDGHESPEILSDVCDRAGIGALLAIPIVHDRSTIGWLAVLSRSSLAFHDQQASTLELMATLLGGPLQLAQSAEAHRSLVAERSRAQAAHRESEARFRAAMDASLDALFILGAVRDTDRSITEFVLLDANRRAEEFCGIEHEAFAGHPLAEVPSAQRELASISVLASVVQTRRPIEREREGIDEAGRARWIHEQIVPLGDGVTVTVRDVTARHEADAEVRRAREAAESANRSKSDFVARMSHELRTPLNSVIGFANILLRNKRNALDDTEVAYLARVKAAGTHLLALINDVLDIAKIEAGHMTLELEPVNVVALARTVLAQLDSQSQASGLVLSLETSTDPLVITADVGKLQQVLFNLVGNAIKFTPAGSVTVRIRADGRDEGVSGAVQCIEITDTGIGIPVERLNAVFEAFEQAESSTSRRYGGTGLGLSISRALCEAMGFELVVESALGAGTTFRIILSE